MDFNINEFRFYHPITMRWNDFDLLGHVNNVLYIDYFQTARGFYMLDASKTWDWKKDMFVIANINCDYIKEIKLNAHNLRVGVRAVKLGSKSFVLEYIVISEEQDRSVTLHAKGTSTQVMIDIVNKRTMELPQWLIDELKDFEPAL